MLRTGEIDSMRAWSPADVEFMARSLRLARLGLYTAHPNPRVGCVLVRDGRVVGEGWHRRTGEAHAEINALADAGESARGSTAYVTLEPCSHHGKTPPCAEALIGAGVRSVVAAMDDPNPKVAGGGIALLRDAGIEVRTGLLGAEAALLNQGFVSRVAHGRPFVRLKIAASLDGRTAMASGESRWITGKASRADVQRLRAAAGAVMTGVGTIAGDDPSLTVRDPAIDTGGRQPVRVVLDSNLRTPPPAKLLGEDGVTIIYCARDDGRAALERAGATVVRFAGQGGRVDPGAVLADLAGRGINDVLVESGPTLAGALLSAGLVDELVIYLAPHIMGSETRGMVTTPGWLGLDQRLELTIGDVRRTGRDLRVTARPVR